MGLPGFLLSLLSRIKREETGGVIILVAISIVVLMGMAALVIDVGGMYTARRQMVNAADAAALAGAQELVLGGDIKGISNYYAKTLNEADTAEVYVDLDKQTVTVEAEKLVEFTFARVLGFSNTEVPARAVAVAGPLRKAAGLIPIGVPENKLVDEGETMEVIRFKMDFGPGNWGWISFEGTGNQFNPNTIADHIRDGYPELVEVGDPIQTRTGTFNPKMATEVDEHISNGNKVFVPIVEEGTGTGTEEFTIVGFAAIVLEEREGNPAHTTITARVEEGEFASGIIDPEGPDYGLKGIALIE